MDEGVKKDIETEAHAIHSMPMVNAKKELNKIQAMMMDPKIAVNAKAVLQTKRGPLVQRMTALRLEFAKVKEAKINELAEKYQNIDKSEIATYLEGCLADCESENCMGFARVIKERALDSKLVIYLPEQVTLTIPAVYEKPTKSDMAVLLVYFNACSYKNLERNLRLTYQSLIDAEIPVFLVEHLFKDQEPIFPENGNTIFNTRSDSYMFYKENLLNWLMPKVPAQFTKFYMMDCDLIFSSPTWYDDVSALLDTYDVVQPFEEAIWLKSDLKTVLDKRIGFAYGWHLHHKLNLTKYHPGFAWAFRRDFIEPIGIFDLNILGSGDTILASAAIQQNYIQKVWHTRTLEKYRILSEEYIDKFNSVKTTYYSNIVYHLWHGSLSNRHYYNRYERFESVYMKYFTTIDENIFHHNSYGLYEYKEDLREPFNQIILEYFESRNEDEDPIIATPPICNIINTSDNIILYIKNTCDYHYEIIPFVLEKYETIIKTNIDKSSKGVEIFLNCGPSESFKKFVNNMYPNVKLEVPKYCNYYINCTIYKNDEPYIRLNRNAYYIAHEVFPTENKNIIFLTPLNNTNYILCDRLAYCDNVKVAEFPIFVIQGDIKRRDLDILKIILEGSYDYDYRIKILGSSRLPSDFDKYSDKLILKYDLDFIDYHTEFLDCYCILPLITKDIRPEYYCRKLTSSIIYGLAYNLHFLIDKDLQDIYNLKNVSIFENKGEITECFKSVLATFTSGAKYRS